MKAFLKIFISMVLTVAIVGIIFSVKINYAEVIGNTKSSDIEILSELFKSELDKTSLVFFLKEKLNGHKNIKYLSGYEVEWVTPFSIVINVKENPAIAYVRRDLKKVYFDKDGIINEVSDEVDDDLIEVEGVSFKSYEKGDKISTNDIKVVNAILNVSSIVYEKKIPASLMEITRDNEILLYVGNIIVELGDTQNMEIKLQLLYDIYKEIADMSGTLDLSNARENMLDEQYIFKKN